jgi:N-acetylglucosamine kinase-like BadF-type ATPase
MVHGLYTGRLDHHRIPHLTPVVFAAAGDGDVVARSIVDRLADELVTMASALIRRLGMQRLDPEVVLAGGVFRATDRAFYERIESGIRRAAPKGRMVRLTAPPVLGSALIGLDRIGAGAEAETRITESLEAWAGGGSVDAGRTPTATGRPAASHRRAARVSSR